MLFEHLRENGEDRSRAQGRRERRADQQHDDDVGELQHKEEEQTLVERLDIEPFPDFSAK